MFLTSNIQINISKRVASPANNGFLFKVPRNPLQSITSPSSKYHITLFKVSHTPLQSTTHPSTKYHTPLFKVPHTPLQSITPHYTTHSQIP